MTRHFLNSCLKLASHGCVAGCVLFTAVPPVNAAQNDDHWVGVYSADLQGHCDVKPLFKIAKEDGDIVGYLQGDDGSWHDAELVPITRKKLKKTFPEKDLNGVSMLVLEESTVIVHAPPGWRYDEKFATWTGDFAVFPFNAVLDLQKTDVAADDPDLPMKQRMVCLKNRSQAQNLSAFLWARRLKESLPARLRESVAKQDSKLVHRR
ncbi:hypothetical protein ACFPAA_24260, partial [Paraburkholderia caffeinitolerans]